MTAPSLLIGDSSSFLAALIAMGCIYGLISFKAHRAARRNKTK